MKKSILSLVLVLVLCMNMVLTTVAYEHKILAETIYPYQGDGVSSSALAEVNRSYERNISATVNDRITVELNLSIHNLIGILDMELPLEGETKKAEVYVVKDPSDAKVKIPRSLDKTVYYDNDSNSEVIVGWGAEFDTDNGYSGKVEVEIVDSDRPIYTADIYPSWYDYDPDRGFYKSNLSGEGFSKAEGGEVTLYYNGLSEGRVFFLYSLEPLGYESYYDVVNAGEGDSLYEFWVGTNYLLVLSDEEIEYFLANGELPEYEGFKWPGLSDLLTENNTYINFTAEYEYTLGQFTDITNQWYADSIKKVYELGLMKGISDGKFNPDGTINLAEAITMAARLHNICTGGSGDFTQGTPWYNVYVDYAVKNGIIKQDDFSDYSLKATRGEMAYIFASAIPNAVARINSVGSLPDVDEYTKYHDSIFLLYRAGVITGNDAIGTFEPETNITRAQAAAIITRIALPSERKTLTY